MKSLLMIAGLAMSVSAFAAPKSVRGYIKSSGTYVAPHIKSSPNTYKFDNYSSKTMGGTKADEFHPPKAPPIKQPRKLK